MKHRLATAPLITMRRSGVPRSHVIWSCQSTSDVIFSFITSNIIRLVEWWLVAYQNTSEQHCIRSSQWSHWPPGQNGNPAESPRTQRRGEDRRPVRQWPGAEEDHGDTADGYTVSWTEYEYWRDADNLQNQAAGGNIPGLILRHQTHVHYPNSTEVTRRHLMWTRGRRRNTHGP